MIKHLKLQNTILFLLCLSAFSGVFFPVSAYAQKSVIRGSIQDANTSETIIGASVVEYDQDQRIVKGTISDFNGNFTLTVSNPNALLVISYIGYKKKEIELSNDNFLQLKLEPQSIGIEDIVVTATTDFDPITGVSKRDQTSSRVKVDMMESKDLGAVSAEEALQGQVSGLDIISASGDPGSGSQIVIRGLGSIGGAQPLIVVDGIAQDVRIDPSFDFGSADQEDIGDMVSIAPQDIKSIEVLKDAASTAVWGTKGANGVLLIETFRGKRGATKFDYQGKYTVNVDPPPVPMLNGDQYVMLQLEEHHNALGEYTLPDEIAYDPTFADFHNYSANTDWVDAITRRGFINDQYLKVSGGGSKTRYFTSVNYLSNTGTIDNTSLDRISTRINLDYDISTKLRFSVNFSYTNSNKEDNYTFRANLGNGNKKVDVREMAFYKAPNMSIWEHDQFGQLTGEYFMPINSYQGDGTTFFNPVAITDLSRNDVIENSVLNSYVLDFKILPWLRFKETISFQYLNEKKIQFLPFNAIGADWLDNSNNDALEANAVNTKIATRSQLFFLPDLGPNHSLSSALMFETDQKTQEFSTIRSNRSPGSDLFDPASNAIIQSIKSGSNEFRAIGGLMNTNYKFKNRYLTTINFRVDGSSKFGIDRRWAIFPSASLGWIFTEEAFLSHSLVLTEGKLRVSYGISGNEPNSPYARHAIYNTTTPSLYIDNPIIIPQQIQLDNLKWESMMQSNLGLDLDFFKGRLNMTAEIYRKRTNDLLDRNYNIPKSSGFDQLLWFNGGTIENNGWEFYAKGYPIREKDMSLSFNFNISHNSNAFTQFTDNFVAEKATAIGNGRYPRRAELNKPIGSFYGFKYLGVWPSTDDVIAVNEEGKPIVNSDGEPIPLSYANGYIFQGGDAKYDDINHDGVIDLNDAVYLGDSNPNFFGGFGSAFNYKDFNLSFQFLYRFGFQIVNEIAMNTEGMLNKNNQSTAVLHRWRKEGQREAGMIPRAYLDHPANNLGSDRYVESGDFVRLNNISFRYRMNKRLVKKLPISSMDIAFTMRKVLTLTNYSGVNPEIAQKSGDDPFWFGTDKGETPPPKSFTFSISVGF